MTKLLALPFLLCSLLASAQVTVTGQWTTIDDETKKPRSVVEIYERNGKLYGKVIKIHFNPGDVTDPVCDQCAKDDPRFGKKVIGMEILKDLEKDGDEYDDGTILDPNNGKVYTCKIWVDGSDLKVRGYLGPFFRTQTWKKVH